MEKKLKFGLFGWRGMFIINDIHLMYYTSVFDLNPVFRIPLKAIQDIHVLPIRIGRSQLQVEVPQMAVGKLNLPTKYANKALKLGY